MATALGAESQARRRPGLRPPSGLALALALAIGVPASVAAVRLAAPRDALVEKQAVAAAVQRGERVGPLVAHQGRQRLYAARSSRGAVTLELASDDGSAVSTFPARVPALAVAQSSPWTVYGRLAGRASRVELRFPDGARVPVPLTTDRFFLVDVPAGHGAAVDLAAIDASGATVAHEPLRAP